MDSTGVLSWLGGRGSGVRERLLAPRSSARPGLHGLIVGIFRIDGFLSSRVSYTRGLTVCCKHIVGGQCVRVCVCVCLKHGILSKFPHLPSCLSLLCFPLLCLYVRMLFLLSRARPVR